MTVIHVKDVIPGDYGKIGDEPFNSLVLAVTKRGAHHENSTPAGIKRTTIIVLTNGIGINELTLYPLVTMTLVSRK